MVLCLAAKTPNTFEVDWPRINAHTVLYCEYQQCAQDVVSSHTVLRVSSAANASFDFSACQSLCKRLCGLLLC
jgi:hypothetical protein